MLQFLNLCFFADALQFTVYLKLAAVPPPTSPEPKSWIELINESVHTSDDIGIVDIDAKSRIRFNKQ